MKMLALILALILAMLVAVPSIAFAGHSGVSIFATGPALPSTVHDGFRVFHLPPITGSVLHPATFFSLSTSRLVTVSSFRTFGFSAFGFDGHPFATGFMFRGGFFCC